MSIGRIIVDLLARTGSFETDMNRSAKLAAKRAKEIDEAFEIEPSKGQSRCPVCSKPFMYWPIRDEVVLRDGQYVHDRCVGTCSDCPHPMNEHYDGVFCMVGDCTCKMHGGE